MNQATILKVLADCKKAAKDKAARQRIDQLAILHITQDIGNPIKMADNLKYWLDRCAA